MYTEHSPQVEKKAFRSKAAEANIPFRVAAGKRTQVLAAHKIYPRNRTTVHGSYSRVDGTYWNNMALTCVRKTHGVLLGDFVEDDVVTGCPLCEEERRRHCATSSGEGSPPRTVILDSLLDIAKPAKLKGLAKEFEIVACPPRVIALPEFDSSQDSEVWEEDWTSDDEDCWQVETEFGTLHQDRRTYSAVVIGKEHDETGDGDG